MRKSSGWVAVGLVLSIVIAACGGRQQPPAPADAPPPAFRLPDTVRPVSYQLDLTLTPGAERFTGSVDIEVELRAPTRTIWMHAEELVVREATVAGQRARTRTTKPSWLALDLPADVGPGPARVHLDYEGAIDGKTGTGIFQGKLEGKSYIYTQMEPHFARQAFPAFDEPGLKVPWQVTLRIPAGNVAFSNTPVESESAGDEGTRILRFARTRPMPSYLVAFAVGPFDVVDGGVAGRNKTPLRYIVPSGHGAKAAYLVRSMPGVLAEIEAYLDIPFPYEKLDIVAAVAPIWFHGAMENTGLIVSGMEFILATDETLAFRRGAMGLMAHEIAHQWFGNLVTPAWWDDLWLNESFASWMGDRALAALEPSFQRDADHVGSLRWAMTSDLAPTSRPIHRAVTNDYEIQDVFDGISYSKGQTILGMIEAWLGAGVFQRGIHEYLVAHADGVATSKDFFAAVTKAAGKDLAPVLHAFIEQPGVPLIEVQTSCLAGNGRLRLSQRRLEPAGQDLPDQRWSVPVCVRHGRRAEPGTTECFVFEGPTLERSLGGGCPDWLVLNGGHRGYFVGALEPATLERALANRDRLAPVELLGMLADLHTLVDAGQFPVAEALRVTEPLLASADPDVRTALMLIDGLVYSYVGHDRLDEVGRAIAARHGAIGAKLGALPRAGEDAATTDLRRRVGTLVGARAGDARLTVPALEATHRWLRDRSSLDRVSLYWVPAAAARVGGAELLAAFKAAARGATVIDVDTMVFSAGWFREPELVREAFEWALTGADVPADTSYVVLYAPPGPGLQVLRQLAEEHIDALIARVPSTSHIQLIAALGHERCDDAERAGFVRLLEKRAAAMTDGAQAYAEKLAAIDQCIAVRKVQEPGIHAWLASRAKR